MNRTRQYLSPILLSYGGELTERMHTIFKLAYGIGDVLRIDEANMELEKRIFILVDTTIDTPAVHEFQVWFRQQGYYSSDYAYDDINTGHLHMFVIKFPEEYYKSFDMFLGGSYSKMYNEATIAAYFFNPTTRKILLKDNSYVVEFSEKINKLFETEVTFTPEDFSENHEFDLPFDPREELFNQETVLRKIKESKSKQEWG